MPASPSATIDEYLDALPDSVRDIVERIQAMVREVVPEAVECMSYGIPTFKLKGKTFIHFAAFKNHISLFPRSLAMEAHFGDEIEPFS